MKSHQHIKVRHQWSIMHLHKWKHKKTLCLCSHCHPAYKQTHIPPPWLRWWSKQRFFMPEETLALTSWPPCHQSGHLPLHTHRHTLSYVNLCTANTRTLAHTLRHTHAWTYSKRACTHKQCALPALSHTHTLHVQKCSVYTHIPTITYLTTPVRTYIHSHQDNVLFEQQWWNECGTVVLSLWEPKGHQGPQCAKWLLVTTTTLSACKP